MTYCVTMLLIDVNYGVHGLDKLDRGFGRHGDCNDKIGLVIDGVEDMVVATD